MNGGVNITPKVPHSRQALMVYLVGPTAALSPFVQDSRHQLALLADLSGHLHFGLEGRLLALLALKGCTLLKEAARAVKAEIQLFLMYSY